MSKEEVPLSPSDRFQQMYYVDEILYMLVMPIIKIAILCTYLRIFTNIKFKRLVYGTIGLNVAYAIAFSLITIFQCTPVKNVCLTLPTPRDTDLTHSFIYLFVLLLISFLLGDSHRHGKTGIKVVRVDATILMRNLGLLPVGILFWIWWW